MRINPLIGKVVALSAIFIFLMAIIGILHGKVRERASLSKEVKYEIENTYSRGQVLMGPYLRVKYKHSYQVQDVTKQGKAFTLWEYTYKYLTFTPETYNVDTQMTVEMRKRGIYQTPVYQTTNHITGSFALPENFDVMGEHDEIISAHLVTGFSDMRGLINIPEIEFTRNNDNTAVQAFTFSSADTDLFNNDATQYESLLTTNVMDLLSDKNQTLDFSMNIHLKGSDYFSVAPIGNSTHVKIASDWAHPSYFGLLLPTSKESNESTSGKVGFSAAWQTNHIASSEAINCFMRYNFCSNENKAISVRLADPVNHYLKSERSVKYGYLFIMLTFLAFFLFEVLKKIKIHSIQYTLVGIALSMFYLLLLSFSEHLGFALAYLIAASACVLLISLYVISILKSLKFGLGFGGGLSAIYGCLYAILLSEDYALLMGSVLVFVAVAVMMLATRNVDWHQFGRSTTPSTKQTT